MGINIPTKEELIANKPEFQNIAGYIGERYYERCLHLKYVSILHDHVNTQAVLQGPTVFSI